MKRICLLFLFFVFNVSIAHAVTLYGCTAGGTFSGSIWTATTLDQAACASGVGPGTTNDLVLNAASGNVTISGAAAANSINETGYTGTLAFGTQTLTLAAASSIGGAMTSTSGVLTTTGGITLLSTATGTFPTLKMNATSTLTSGGFTWPGSFTFGGTSQTYTLSGILTISGDLIFSGTTLITIATSGNNIAVTGNLNIATNTTLTGAGTLSATNFSITGGFGQWTLTSASALTFTGTVTVQSGSASSLQFAGTAPSITMATLLYGGGQNGTSVSFPAGCIVTVNTALRLAVPPGVTLTLFSATASTPFFINYTGPISGINLSGINFTDAYSFTPLYVYRGGTETRTQNIFNVTQATIYKKAINSYNGV